MRFEFATAARIVFGPGAGREAPAAAAAVGRRVLLVTGREAERAGPLAAGLREQRLEVETLSVSGEPTVDTVTAGLERARDAGTDVIIGLGGGSTLDTGKAIAALLANGGEPLDYLEVIGRGKPLTRPSIPYIAIPTTAGTGTEVTRNAVLGSPAHRVKVSLRSPLMLPRLALVDPELTYSLPPAVTASSGLDALTQMIEPFTCNSPNLLVDALCADGMRRTARSLRRAFKNGQDASAREDMSLAGLYGGLALANARLGAAHGLAGPLGGLFPAPHGALCARLLPLVMETNIRALKERAPGSPVLVRYGEVAHLLTGESRAEAQDGVEWVKELCMDLAVPPLSAYGVKEADIPVVVPQAQKASSMKGNPIPLTDEELAEILRRAL